MKNEVYGNLSIDVSRATNQTNRDDAIYESECEIGAIKVETLIIDFLHTLGLDVHNVEIEWESFFSEEGESE